MRGKKVSVLIKKSALIFDKYANQLLAPYNLTISQFRILMILYKSPDCTVRQADIESAYSMTNPTVTGLVQNLEKSGLVERVANPEDKRSKLLTLTEYAEGKRNELTALAGSLRRSCYTAISCNRSIATVCGPITRMNRWKRLLKRSSLTNTSSC